jgi:hypothetical protein
MSGDQETKRPFVAPSGESLQERSLVQTRDGPILNKLLDGSVQDRLFD